MEAVLAVAHILRREGVEVLFNFPDNRVLEPAATLGIRPLQARTERTAVGMADGYTRVTNARKIGVVLTQFGPGIEAAFGGVAAAYADGTPILVISANMSERRYGQSPDFDPVPNYREITKWAARLAYADRIPQMLRRAFTLLRTGRRGPVLLDLPLEVGRAEVSDEAVEAYRPVRAPRTQASEEDVEEVVRALLSARAPVVHAGQGTLYAEATDELRELAELLEIPVMTTLVAKSAFSEDHPLSLGSGGGSWPDAAQRFVAQADLVFGVGTSLTDNAYSMPVPTDGKTIVQLSVDERDFNKDRRADILLMGDAKLVLRQILERIRRGPGVPRTDGARIRDLASAKKTWTETWVPKLKADDVPINPYRVIGELMEGLDLDRTVVTHDAGKPRDQTSPMWTARAPRSYVGWGKSTPLGYGLGLIMGAKLGLPDRFAVNIMGDAAIGMSGMDIETAVRLRIPVMTVVLNNGAMTQYESRYPVAHERFGFKYLTGDYARLAEALGATGICVNRPEDLRGAIQRARETVESGGVALLDVRTREEPAVSNHR